MFLSRFLHPDVDRHLIIDEGEEIVDEVHKHPMAVAWALGGLVLCMAIFLAMPLVGVAWPVLLIAGLLLMVRCVWAIHSAHMDRFVITNHRVFRVHGIVNQQTATMHGQPSVTVSHEDLRVVMTANHHSFGGLRL